MKKTLPTRKVSHRVFLDTDHDGSCLLEVKRQNFFLYEINSQGEERLLGENLTPYAPAIDEREEDYYLDYLDGKALRKIDLLTTVFNYGEVIEGLQSLIYTIEKDYSFRDFSMEHAYLIEDFKDVLSQLASFTDDGEYFAHASEMEKFFNTYFYDRSFELSPEDKELVITKLKQEISFLNSLTLQ